MKELVAMMLMVLIATPAMANIIIDSFDVNTHEAYYNAGGGVQISTYAGVGPIGGERVLRAFNNHNNNRARVKVDATAGTCEIWGDTNAANRSINWGQTNSGDASGTVELNLDLTSALALEIDFVSLAANTTPSIYLRTNYGEGSQADFSVSPALTASGSPFTVSIPLGDFGMTAADLADVDGIRLWSYDSAHAFMDEWRITEAGAVVPEPGGLGLIGLALLAVRRRRS